MTTPFLKFKVTAAGLAAVVSAQAGGLQASFSHVAVGFGVASGANGVGYQPTGDETALKNEFLRVALGSGQKPSATQIAFGATLDGDPQGWINEIGLFLSNGTLWAVWSEDPAVQQSVDPATGAPVFGAPLGYKMRGIAYAFTALVTVQAFALDALQIILNGPPISLQINLYDDQISNLLAIVADRARALHDLERARRADAALIADLTRRVRALEGVTG